MRFANRNIIQSAHADGTIRIYDVGNGDEIENEDVVQVDVARAVGRYEAIDIIQMSVSGSTGELAVGLASGELVGDGLACLVWLTMQVIFRWGRNPKYGRESPHEEARAFGLEAIDDRAEPGLKEGLLPFTLFDQKRSPVTSLRASDVGFVSAGFQDGSIVVIDLRGPAVIYDSNLQDLHGRSRRKQSTAGQEWATVMEFGVMSLEGEGPSPLLSPALRS